MISRLFIAFSVFTIIHAIPVPSSDTTEGSSSTNSSIVEYAVATFGAGCFWGVERYFEKKFGNELNSSKVGYMGGPKANPTYEDVCTGTSEHAEVAQFVYDPTWVTYEELVLYFWRIHDPTTLNRQGNDHGTQYRSVIFYHNEEQRVIAGKILEVVKSKFADPITTAITPAAVFYEAEKDHQDYLQRFPNGYDNHYLYW